MEQLSKWSRHTTMQAKFNFSRYHVLVMANVLWLGTQLFTLDWDESNWLLSITANLLFLPFLCFPIRENPKIEPYSAFVKRYNRLHFGLATLYILILVTVINNTLTQAPKDNRLPTEVAGFFIVIRPDLPETDPIKKPDNPGIRETMTVIWNWFKQEVRELKQLLKPDEEKKKVTAGQVLSITFIIFISAFLMLAMLGFANSISVKNGGPLGLVIALIGWAGIIWLTVFVINKILNNPDQNKKE